jgi:hypothetical protein
MTLWDALISGRYACPLLSFPLVSDSSAQVEGEPAHAELLRTALNEVTVASALAVIVLDFSHPWTLASSLKKWLDILAEQLRGASNNFKPLEEQMRTYAQTYLKRWWGIR